MLHIYNKTAVTRKQRFTKALIYGILATVACGVLQILVSNMIPYIGFSFLFMLWGYSIGYVIEEMGHGVQIQFSILAAVLTVILIIVVDCLQYGNCLLVWVSYLSQITADPLNTLLFFGYRIVGIYLAFNTARMA